MAFGTAAAMAYLESKNVLHLDLSCRNLLVNYSNAKWLVKVSMKNLLVLIIPKVCDFGLSRINKTTEYKLHDIKIPIRWSAPELLQNSICSIKSDVWSFGVCLLHHHNLKLLAGHTLGDTGTWQGKSLQSSLP